MTAVGVTGHQVVPSAALSFTRSGIAEILKRFREDLTGISSLAAGSDQMFAHQVLDVGGRLHAVIPCLQYESSFSETQQLQVFRDLLQKAAVVETLAHPEPSEDAFWQAGRRVVELSQVLIAVWDGEPSRGKGGTADVVKFARERKIETFVVWPPGLSR